MTPETALPSGTVTFLFTDIESSSGLWEADPDAMSVTLAGHDEMVRSAITSEAGVVFKHLGDGLCAAFDSAPNAAAAAIAAQRGLAAQHWDGVGRLSVRMGLHTGSLVPTDGDYFGPVVNRAARVMGAANGGQVVGSAATAGLCGDLEWVDHGVHALRGVGDEHLFALAGHGLVGAERSLRGLDDVGLRPPSDPTSFVGRDRDMIDLTAALHVNRLVTLVGVGGVGKTRLALETVTIAGDRFDGGVWWCDLAPVSDGEAMLAAVSSAVGARPQPGMDAAASIVNHLESRELLLVLDNCEHLTAEVGRLVEALMAADKVVVLATSREPLGLRAEQVWAVGSLDSDGSGVELFMDRARQRDRGFVLADQQVRVVGEICRRLDGIPLAIELAAARTRSMSVQAIEERLGDRFRLLRGGRKGERHQTLRDAVGWSYDLLSAEEAALFDRLSVFSGGFTLEAAESICVDDVVDEFEVVDLLEALVDKSMLVADLSDDGVRYRLLETMRQYAQEQLHGTGAAELFRDAHLRFYRELAVRLSTDFYSARAAHCWAPFDLEWDNLRVAQDHARLVGDFDAAGDVIAATAEFALSSQRHEGLEWAATLLDEPGVTTIPAYGHLCGAAAAEAWLRLDRDRALHWASLAVEAAPANRTSRDIEILLALADGDRSRAAQSLRSWRAALGDMPAAADIVTIELHTAMCDHSPASEPAAERAEAAAQQTRSPTQLATGCWARFFATSDSDPDQAVAALNAMAAHASSTSNRHMGLLNARLYLADYGSRRLTADAALSYCADALGMATENHHIAGVYMALEATALSLARLGHLEPATVLVGHVVASGHSTDRQQRRIEPHITSAAKEAAVRGSKLTRRQATVYALTTIDASQTKN